MKTPFYNPFEKHSTQSLLLVGTLSMLVGAVAGVYFNARFDGIIDLHFVKDVRLHEPILDLLIAIGTTTILLFLLGKTINAKTRLIDLLNTALIAKMPFYLLTVFNYNGFMFKITEKLMAGVRENALNVPDASLWLPILVFSSISLAALALCLILFYLGYKTATNAKGIKNTFLFVGALLVSELLSKLFLSLLA